MDPESTVGPLESTATSASIGDRASLMTSTPLVPRMKMEFPGSPPEYGHGFGPPIALALDLSPRGVQLDHPVTDPAIQSPFVSVDGESGAESILSVCIKREVKTESTDLNAIDDDEDGDNGDPQDEDQTELEGCSRTVARMPEASLLKWHQRRRRKQQEEQTIQPTIPPLVMAEELPQSLDLLSASPAPKRKALLHPSTRKHGGGSATTSSTTNSAIPVGIAVARQRREKSRADTPAPLVQPKARRAEQQTSPVVFQSQQQLPLTADPVIATERLCMSTPSAGSIEQQHFSHPTLGGLGINPNYSTGRSIYNPSALYAGHPANPAANWGWPNNPVDYGPAATHSLWPTSADMNSMMAYPSYPPTPPASNISLHHHHPAAGGLNPPPFLLIPAACLDPYQRAAAAHMLWPGYAATTHSSPWALPPEMASTPTSPWTLHPAPRSAFELPPLLRTDVAVYQDPVDDVAKSECVPLSRPVENCAGRQEAEIQKVKQEPVSPEPPAVASVREETSSILSESVVSIQPESSIRVRDNMTIESADHPAESSVSTASSSANPLKQDEADPSADYSGLQLLSDSIERFVASDPDHRVNHCQPESTTSVNKSHPIGVEVAGNALDVLCAAAMYQQSGSNPETECKSERPSLPAVSSPPSSSQPHPTGFQIEFDFRSKLAELQRKYKEKQKELSSLKCRKKSDKKKKRSSQDKEEKSSRRRNSSSSSSRDGSYNSATKHQQDQPSESAKMVTTQVDFICPGRLALTSSALRSTDDSGTVELPRIPTSYAAALASAATSIIGSSTTTTATIPAEKKKRKPDFPVRKQDGELTETIVPSKKRKFFQLFQWCHSADNITEKKSDKKKNGTKNTTNPIKPKMKPKLKAEVQVKRELSSDESADEEEEFQDDHLKHDRLEKHCLPALQYLQLSDDSGNENDPLPAVPSVGPSVSISSPVPSPARPPSPPPPPPLSPQPTETVETVETVTPVEIATPVSPTNIKMDPEENIEPKLEPVEQGTPKSPWLLTQDLLKDGLRVLISEEGLFHGGFVSGIRPPDIYGVVVDGERGSRPRILSTEELLLVALQEVRPLGLDQLSVGTRVCAYWSRKSRCLYPGVVSNIHPAKQTSTGHKNATKEDEIFVEFDDGDSGRILVSQVRLLPPDYPVLERDPNPLLTLESRRPKRRISEPTSLPALVPVAVKRSALGKETANLNGQEKLDKIDDSKENMTDDGNAQFVQSKKEKKHKKKHKKKRKSVGTDQEDLIIPVSPGIDPAAAVDELTSDPASETAVKMETRGSKESVTSSVSAITRPSAKTRSPEPQQQQRKSGGKSKIAAFLPERQLWQWLGGSFKKASKGKGRKEFYKAIHRGDEIIRVGDCAVFLSAARPDRPYVGRIELLWQSWGGSMTVKVRWFYHPEETCGGRRLTHLKIPGALFESNHADENDVQTISHCCTVSSLEDYQLLCRGKPDVNLNLDANNQGSCYDQFYLAGFYDPTSGHLSFEPGVMEQLH